MNGNKALIEEIKAIYGQTEHKAYVRSFGCQLNVSDGEKIKGVLSGMGFTFTDDEREADLIILNTCAVRESAEDRVFGIVGSMKKLKEENPSLIIGIAGCMTAQEHIAEKIKRSYPQVDIVLGTSAINGLPALLLDCLRGYHFPGNCEILAGEPVLSPGKEGSAVLMLPVTGGRGWAQLQQSVKKQMGTPCQASPHITLAASKDKALLRAYKDRLLQSGLFPLHLTVTGAQLYHIWTPVALTASFR